jgi:hypothetical protein
LKSAIADIVEQSLTSINDSIAKRTATESLARVALQTPQHSSTNTPVSDFNPYRDAYNTTAPSLTDPALTSQAPTYTMPVPSPHPYTLGPPISMPQRAFDHPASYAPDDPNMSTSHVAALAAASSQPSDGYVYAQSGGSSGPPYATNGYAQQDWRQWTRTYMQPAQQPGEYLNTATTLMALGGREHGDEGGVHWPELAYGHSGGHPGGGGHGQAQGHGHGGGGLGGQ